MWITEIPFPVWLLQYRIAREPPVWIDQRFVSQQKRTEASAAGGW